MLAGNLVLALMWMAMTARFDLSNLILGMAFGYVVLYASQVAVGTSVYFSKSVRLVRFMGFYALEVVRSNIRVAVDVDHADPAREAGHRGYPAGGAQ